MYTEIEIAKFCLGNWSNLKNFQDGEQAYIIKMAYTCAIVYEINDSGFAERWCYHNYLDAKKALDNWDGTGEPSGWHRHPRTGRRIDDDGKVYIRG